MEDRNAADQVRAIKPSALPPITELYKKKGSIIPTLSGAELSINWKFNKQATRDQVVRLQMSQVDPKTGERVTLDCILPTQVLSHFTRMS